MGFYLVTVGASNVALCDLSLDSFEILCFTDERFTEIEVLIFSVVELQSEWITLTTIDTWVIR
jgi:hypothetical protein